MNELSLIENIAKSVRQDLELFQKKNKVWTKGLRGACATASYLIQQELRSHGIDSYIVYAHRQPFRGPSGTAHAWLETKEFIIDVTYTQFKSGFPVVIINKADEDLVSFYCRDFKGETIGEVSVDFFSSWKETENPLICGPKVKALKSV